MMGLRRCIPAGPYLLQHLFQQVEAYATRVDSNSW